MHLTESVHLTWRKRLADLLEHTQQTSHAGSLPFVISGHACGVIYPPAAQILRQAFPDKVAYDTFALGPTQTREHLNAELMAVAHCLYEQGCLPKWRDELLDVWLVSASDSASDSAWTSIGAIERGAVRALGLGTRAVDLNAWSPSGDLWVARRAIDKATDPGMWDTLVGGLVGYEEGDDLALVRESDEEAGLDEPTIVHRTPIRCVTRMQRRLPEGYQCEQVLTSECVLAAEVVPANRDGEVMTIACLPVSEVSEMLLDDAFTVEASIVILDALLNRFDPAGQVGRADHA